LGVEFEEKIYVYKILNTQGLGVGGKQNELIELALTHGFNGVEVDMVDLVGRHDALGKQFACQFLQSAKIDMGTFKLPIDLGATDEDYAAASANLDTIIDLATTLNARCCCIVVEPNNANLSFQECFETYEERLKGLADKFADGPTKIGLALSASRADAEEGTFKFIQTAEEILTLIKTVGKPNVGLCLDAWEWVVGGGTIEHLTAAGIDKVLVEARLVDVSADADLNAIKVTDRTSLPGETEDSFSVQVAQAIIASGADIPVSIASDTSTYSAGSRDSNVAKLSKRLDQLIAGENPAKLAAEAAAAEAAAAEGEEAEAAETPAATTTS
jgi:sugar phosphate isomerase/epimerase